MDITVFTNLITNIGFPIACCIIMALYIYKQEILHREEMESLRETIEHNTEMLNKILTYIEYLENSTSKKED